MLKLNLEYLLNLKAEKGKVGFLKRNGFSQAEAVNLASGKTKRLSIINIYKLCLAFKCTPNDLFLFIEDNKNQLAKNHPLNSLKIGMVNNVSEILGNMS